VAAPAAERSLGGNLVELGGAETALQERAHARGRLVQVEGVELGGVLGDVAVLAQDPEGDARLEEAEQATEGERQKAQLPRLARRRQLGPTRFPVEDEDRVAAVDDVLQVGGAGNLAVLEAVGFVLA